MADIGTGLLQAAKLIVALDRELLAVVFLSLRVSGFAVATAALIGIPLGAFLGMRPPASVRGLEKLINTLMGLPPVVAGLVIYMLLSNKGPIGHMQLLFTPMAMIIAQTVLATPIITGLSLVAVRDKHKEIRDTAVTLGAGRQMVIWTVIREAKRAIVAAVVAGFGRVVAEVGAVMMVGGNIQGSTRVMTTAIVLETRKGNFEFALGLGIILLTIAFIINSLLYRVQGEVRNN